MAEETVNISGKPSSENQQIDPQRLAWGVLLLTFAVFCVICVAILVGGDFFLFQSSVPVSVMLNVGRGSVGVTDLANPVEERKARNGDTLSEGIIVTTDPTSQGTVILGGEGTDTFQTMITLGRSSSFTLLNASKPRFEWSRTQPRITLDDVIGRIQIEVQTVDNHGVEIVLETPAGATVHIDRAGQYEIEAASDQLRVFNQRGRAILIPPDIQLGGRDVPVGGLGMLNYVDSSTELVGGYQELLGDSYLAALDISDQALGSSEWNCSNAPGNDPPSRFGFIEQAGLDVLQFYRDDNAETHGWTFCVQSFGQDGIVVDSAIYDRLFLRSSFYIAHQSLGTCGFNASECPFTLRVDYIDVDGEPRKWFHGFYTWETSGFPTRCNSETCREDHDLVQGQAWYTYESPNLLTFFQPPSDAITDGLPDFTPQRILSVWLYASGHEYDVRVREATLLALERRENS